MSPADLGELVGAGNGAGGRRPVTAEPGPAAPRIRDGGL